MAHSKGSLRRLTNDNLVKEIRMEDAKYSFLHNSTESVNLLTQEDLERQYASWIKSDQADSFLKGQFQYFSSKFPGENETFVIQKLFELEKNLLGAYNKSSINYPQSCTALSNTDQAALVAVQSGLHFLHALFQYHSNRPTRL